MPRRYHGTRSSRSPNGLFRFQAVINALDDMCLAYLRRRHEHSDDASATRYAIVRRAAQDNRQPDGVCREPLVSKFIQAAIWRGADLISLRQDIIETRRAVRAETRGDTGEAKDRLKQLDALTAGQRLFCIWLRDSDDANLIGIQVRWNLNSQAEALRLAIRLQAAAEGFIPPGGWVVSSAAAAVVTAS